MIFHTIYKKPILIVGNGVRSAGAADVLNQFYDKTKIPILTTMNAVDLTLDENKIGFIGIYGNRIANLILKETDLVIAIGARLSLRQIGNKVEYFAPKAKLIRADIDEYELSRTIKEDEIKYLIDAKEFLLQLLDENIPSYSSWNSKCFKAKNILKPYDKELGNHCIETISSLLPEDAIVSVDVGQNQCWSAQSLNIKGNSGRIMIGGGYGSMGCALPWAIGAAYAKRNIPIFCMTGDGGLQMNIQELQAVASQKLPIKILVINNTALGKIREIQALKPYENKFFITDNSSGYSTPDFEDVAKAYKIKSITINDYNDLAKYKDWLIDDEPCLINIILPEDTLLLPKMNWNEKEMLPMLDEAVIQRAIGELLN